ncbi:MAG: hypothetical protein V3U79_11030 [Dehalococcoidia bacterium]
MASPQHEGEVREDQAAILYEYNTPLVVEELDLMLDELATGVYSLDEINSAFDALEKGEVARSVMRF